MIRRPVAGHAAAAALAAALMGASCSRSPEDGANETGGSVAERMRQRARVYVEPARREQVRATVGAVAELEPRGRSLIAAKVGGMVTAVSFQEGTVAAAGTVLAEIDPDNYRLAFERAAAAQELARASLVASEASVRVAAAAQAAAEAELANAQASLRRKEELHGQGYATDQLLDDVKTQVAVAASAVERARADVELQGRNVDRAKRGIDEAAAAAAMAAKDLADCRVATPFAGTVVRKIAEVGSYCGAGDPVCEIVDVSRVKVSFSVTALEATRLAAGMAATFVPRALPQQSFPCTLYFVSPSADPATRMIPCKAWLDNPDGTLTAGWFGTASSVVDALESVVVADTGVLPSDRGFVAFVLTGADTVARREVAIGLRGAGRVQILSGIEEGERVVVAGAQGLEDGQAVEVVADAGGVRGEPRAER